MEFADSSRVGSEREVCINRCMIVGYLWAEREREREREGERGRGKGRGRGRGEGGRGGGGGGGEGTVGFRGQFMFSF